tara:strand:+ start:66 stop:272 length:207 start_codon:yes stop_codon:yes gene_type:complete
MRDAEMMTGDEMDTIIRAYFTCYWILARYTDGEEYNSNHDTVVEILREYPEYAMYYLDEEERGEGYAE